MPFPGLVLAGKAGSSPLYLTEGVPLLPKLRQARVAHARQNNAEAEHVVGIARGSRAPPHLLANVRFVLANLRFVLANGDFSGPELLLRADDTSQARKNSGGTKKSRLARNAEHWRGAAQGNDRVRAPGEGLFAGRLSELTNRDLVLDGAVTGTFDRQRQTP